MPLTRYQIRNEYGLADPELYRAADKDDPEALLEGVAMAGLVGVLRQLGDLAEFAAEIFHDLHEEVMATASRGHGLMVRVQQLEAEFPSIEKVILSQTSHTSFFSNEGVDWHPNLHSEQNLIARGDLPRFVMDSYEECRGPPRLFLLDKFDVAGAGACLKRYTDPSFFKVEYGIETESRPREKKIRRVKPKKGPRWRNGGTPEAGPTSAKLHQLLLEERIENGYNDPARLVKLKKRQLSGSGIDSRTGKSYMERFLETPSPEHKMICEASVAPPSLQLPSEDTTEVGVKILDMIRVSPVASDSPGRESTPSSMVEEEILGPSTDEEITGREIVLVSEPITDGVTEENLLILNKCVVENELIGGEVNAKTIVDEDHSDDMTSEVDNYMDALTTMDSEVDIDNENRSKNDQHFLNIGKHRIEADANEDNLDPQDQFLDPQSFGNSSVSDDGNSSFKKDRSSSSCSDTVSNLGKHRIEVDANEDNLEPQDQFLDPQSFGNSSVSYDGNSSFKKDRSSSSCSDTVSSIGDNTTSDGDIGAKAFLSTPTTGTVDIADAPSSPRPIVADSEETKAHERQLSLETYVDEEKLTNFGVISSSSCPLDLNPALPNSDPETNSSVNLVVGDIEDKTPYDHVSFDSKTSKTMTGLDDIEDVHPDVPSLSRDETYHTVISEFHSVNDVESDVTVDAFLPSSNTLELASEKKIDNACYDELLQREYQDENSAENCFVDSVSTSSTPRQDQLLTSTSMEVESCSDISLLQDNLPAVPVKDGSSNVNSKDHLFEVVNNVTETEVKSEDLPPSTHILSDGPVSKTNGVILEAGLAELHPFNSEEKSNTEENSSLVDVSEMVPFVCNMCVVEANVALTKLPSDYLNNADCEGHINLDESATETVPEDDVNISISADAIPVELTSVGHVEQEENPCFDDIATKAFQPEDVAVSASSGHETAAFFELPSKIINDPILEDQVYSYDFSTLRFQAEDAIVSIVRKTDDEVDEVVCPSLDVISFPSREGEYLHQDDSVFSDQQPLELQINEQVLPQEFQINEQVTPEGFTNEESSQFKIGSTHLDSTSYSKLKILEIVCSSTPNSQFQAERLSVDDVNTCPIAFERRNLELESESPCQSHDFGDMDDIISSPSCLPHSQTLLEQSMGLPLNRLGEHLQAYEEINNVSESFCWEKMDSLNDMDEDNHEKVQSSNLEDCKSCFDTSFQSLGESLPSVPSESKSSPQSGLEEFKSANGAVDHQLPCFVPSFVPLPEAAPVGLEEMPPLPPLPPMQWRLGRIQPTFPAVSGELIEAHGNPFLSMLPSKADSKAKFGSLTADGQPQNPFVCLTESESEITNNVSEQFPIVFSSDALQNSQLTLDDTQSSNPFGTLPAVSNEKPEHVEMLLSKLKPSSHMPMIEDSACEPDNVSFLGNSSHPMNKLSSETGSKFVKLQQTLQNSEGEQWSDPVSSAPSALIKDEQPQPSLMSLEGERASFSNTPAMASTSEVGNPNGNHTSKIARPRNPLIDAAVAHGQSKLRKAADRVLPQIGAKGEERDSLLQQIRTKSFNLKPALSARPNIQGPKHNLKVAAILEKANAIRQALAGSDEDDDNNSWSDSD